MTKPTGYVQDLVEGSSDKVVNNKSRGVSATTVVVLSELHGLDKSCDVAASQ